ncbi:MAG: helix-turn-helix domain-containing protein [Limosilactobacillus sp.]|uniref:winged helix-turn-helix transcriptional regulator n=1 Tax=Limosilactobacillus sp. TaxID=2773925 RepID=UPI0027029E5A|nr:helix-turn-helix domain-containing protein [Limosilactobacillus sp.]
MAKPIEGCSIDQTLQVIAGKWKAVIVQTLLMTPVCRFSELEDQLVGCSRRMLALQLKELEDDGVVLKKVYATVPPKTEYRLSERGKQLEPVINSMQKWGSVQN